jgi:hypothetical protein
MVACHRGDGGSLKRRRRVADEDGLEAGLVEAPSDLSEQGFSVHAPSIPAHMGRERLRVECEDLWSSSFCPMISTCWGGQLSPDGRWVAAGRSADGGADWGEQHDDRTQNWQPDTPEVKR